MNWDKRFGVASLCLCFLLLFLLCNPSALNASLLSPGHKYPSPIADFPPEFNGRAARRVELSGGRKVEPVWDRHLGVYRIKGKPVIWAFWDSAELPALLRLSLASVLCQNLVNLHLELVRAADVPAWLDHVHPAFHLLQPQHQADYFRARILDEFGGMYLDSDTLGFASLARLFAKLLWYDLVNISWPPDGDPISITTMGPMRAGNHLTAAWITDLHLLLDAKLGSLLDHSAEPKLSKYPLGWAEMLRGLVMPIMRQLIATNSIRYFAVNGPTTFGQLVVDGAPDPMLDLSSSPGVSFTFVATELLMFHNSQLPPETRRLDLNETLEAPTLLSELTRLSFLTCRERQRRGEGEAEPPAGAYSVAAPPRLSQDQTLRHWIANFTRTYIPA